MFGYIISILLPPIAMVQQGRPVAAVFALLLCCTVFGYPIAVLIAFISTRKQHIEDKRFSKSLQG
jgi:uncharacterized membrane protein YqaE (UPF0057 family)